VYNQPMGVGFQDSAPAVNLPLREVSPPMTAEASSSTDRRFTLDHSSFEKLLAAAWVLQCLQDQLRAGQLGRDETSAKPVTTQKQMETASSGSHGAVTVELPASPRLMEAESKAVVVTDQRPERETLAGLVKISPPIETETLHFDGGVKVEPATAELKKSFPAEATAPIVRPVLAVSDPANKSDTELIRSRTGFDLRTAFHRALNSFKHLLPTYRVNLTLRAVRAVTIATPVWVLSLVAALLFLGVWRYEPLHSAQAVSTSIPPAAAIVIGNSPRNLATTTRPVSEPVKATVTEPLQYRTAPKTSPPLEVSHKHITDSATLSAVQQMSRYEINGLRRRARYGDESAAFTLGMAYEVGSFVPQNCVEAARWVATSAEAGDAAAQYNLGLRYRDGDGVPASRTESAKWLRKAAAHRSPQARRALKMLASR
jgi:hypothetical protein